MTVVVRWANTDHGVTMLPRQPDEHDREQIDRRPGLKHLLDYATNDIYGEPPFVSETVAVLYDGGWRAESLAKTPTFVLEDWLRDHDLEEHVPNLIDRLACIAAFIDGGVSVSFGRVLAWNRRAKRE